jgi:hypothetical protein
MLSSPGENCDRGILASDVLSFARLRERLPRDELARHEAITGAKFGTSTSICNTNFPGKSFVLFICGDWSNFDACFFYIGCLRQDWKYMTQWIAKAKDIIERLCIARSKTQNRR